MNDRTQTDPALLDAVRDLVRAAVSDLVRPIARAIEDEDADPLVRLRRVRHALAEWSAPSGDLDPVP